ncbi:MAG: hypothetical protein AAB953_00545 [Patescibacteria group bacterium]
MADKTFGGCNIELDTEAREKQATIECSNIPPLPTSPEVEKVKAQCREQVEEGRGIF